MIKDYSLFSSVGLEGMLLCFDISNGLTTSFFSTLGLEGVWTDYG